MKSPLIYDQEDFKWNLLGGIFNIFDSRKTRQILAKNGMKPLNKSVRMLKVIIMAIFFSVDVSFVLNELEKRSELCKFAEIYEIPSNDELSRFMSQFSSIQFINIVLMILNTRFKPRRHNKSRIIVDSTDIQVDLNWFRRKISKKSLENRPFKWGYSSSKSFYIGYKLTLAIDYKTRKPLAFLIHEGSPHDSKIYTEILEELRRRRVMRRGDTIIMDKGYYSYINYQLGVSRYNIVPLIFPKSNFKLQRALNSLSYPIQLFNKTKIENKIKKFFQQLKKEFKRNMENWKHFKYIRSIIEDMFKLAKRSLDMHRIHRYTTESIVKHTSLNVLLMGTIISLGYSSKTELQTLAES